MALPKKILVANRGEIALRVMRSCREMGIETVAVYSEVDRSTPHVRYADQAYCIGAAPSSESYLVMERLMEVAKKSGADAIHPGYGFLSENATFARLVEDAGLIWIGPPTKAIEIMGSKTASRQKMVESGVPVVPGVTKAIESIPEALKIAEDIGYPVMLKAAAGGGGKGMREVNRKEDLEELFIRAQSEAINAFGNGAIYMEKRIINPRHVEIQIMADKHGNVVHLFERDCSIQRRHQKVVEESPCPALLPETREKIAAVAILAAKSVDYVGAGTVECLLSEDQSFYFLEMNTRLQVEHPITEMVTGIDLVQAQIRVAAGEVLAFAQEDIQQHGHAIECRIYAEDAQNNWAPSPGILRGYQEPSGPWVRVDSGVKEGDEVTIFYDPMISKLIVWGQDRDDALRRMGRALSEYRIRGIETTIPFFKSLLQDPDFIEGKYDTGFLSPEKIESLIPKNNYQEIAELAAVIYAFNRDQKMQSPVQQGHAASKWKWSLR